MNAKVFEKVHGTVQPTHTIISPASKKNKKAVFLSFVGGLFLFTLIGCSLIPARVEYFQDKVKPVPEKTEKYVEKEKQAAEFTALMAAETLRAALYEQASTNVTGPAQITADVSKALSSSMGPPAKPYRGDAEVLILHLQRMENELYRKLEEFKKDNNKNVGKEIEGTGLFSIGYFTQFLVIAFLCFIFYIAIRVIGLFNPGVAVGTQVLSGGVRAMTRLAGKGFTEIIRGGEKFKEYVDEKIDDPKTKETILELFRRAQMESQSSEVQEVVAKLTK